MVADTRGKVEKTCIKLVKYNMEKDEMCIPDKEGREIKRTSTFLKVSKTRDLFPEQKHKSLKVMQVK